MLNYFSNPFFVAGWLLTGMCFALYNRSNSKKSVSLFDWFSLTLLGPGSLLLLGIEKLEKIKI